MFSFTITSVLRRMRNRAVVLGALILSLPFVSICTPVRSNLGGDGEEYGDGETYTASDYVQEGLVAMWDGIENVGWGIHDATAQEWIDLVGGETATQFNPIGYFTDKAFNTNSYYDDTFRTRNYLILPESLFNIAATKSFTIEMGGIIRKSKSTNLTVLDLCKNQGFVWLYYGNQPYRQANSLAYYRLFGPIVNRSTWALEQVEGSEDIIFTNASSFNVNTVDCFSGIANMYYRWGMQTDDAEFIQPKMGDLGCNLTIYYLRIYNRPLSEKEMRYNYQIDKSRFSL